MEVLQTRRLTLHEFQDEDAPFVLKLLNTPTWIQFIGDRGVRTIEDARKYIDEKLAKSYKDHGYGLYLLKQKKSGIPVGMCGLVNREGLEDVDIGFAMLPEHAGKGFGYESSLAILDHAKNELQIKRLVAITVPENKYSIQLLEKLGFQIEKKMVWDNGDDILLLGLALN